MPFPNISLSKEDFTNCQWEDAISSVEKQRSEWYSTELWKKSKEAEKSGNTRSQVALALLYVLTSPRLKSDSKDTPFHYMESIENISDEHLDALQDWVADISDNELKARVADVLWIRKRDYRMAQIAVDAYLESAKSLEDPEHWTSYLDRLERATRLSRHANQKKYFNQVIDYRETVLDKYNGEDSSFASAKLMEILQEFKQGEPLKYAPIAEKAANRAEREYNFHKARSYWKVTIAWYRQSKNYEKERQASISDAETYVKEAEDAINRRNPPSYLNASIHLQKAIVAYRNIGGCRERIDELHQRLLNYQQKSTSELISYKKEQDISQIVEEIRNRVSGKSLQNALFTLALMEKSPSVTQIRQQTEQQEKDFIHQHLSLPVYINEMGQVVGNSPSLEDKMFRNAILYQQYQAQAIIEPARYQINLEHHVKIRDFYSIVAENPFIPLGREYIYAKGLYAGLTGDFLVAAHLLIPQIEHSVREILLQRGIITSGFNDEGIQDQHNLNTFFRERQSELKKIFGEDLAFDLEGLLGRKGFGSNLRNLMAHGLISTNDFYNSSIIYLWWLTLRLCCLPLIQMNHNVATDENEIKEHSQSSETEQTS